MATAPNTAPMGQTFPPRLMTPLVGLNVGLLHTYIDSSLTYAESLLQAVTTDERSIMKTAITRGRMALDKAATLRKKKSILIDKESIQEQTKLMCDAIQNLGLVGDIVFKHFENGTILNDRLIATILTASRTNYGR
jgi:hypothetical protein